MSELRTGAAEGLAKLMFSGRLVSSRLLSRLILLWYNPVTEEDLRLRHCLGVFFPMFAYASRYWDPHPESVWNQTPSYPQFLQLSHA